MDMATPGARWWQLVVFLCWCRVAVAGGGTCYPPGGVAGIVVATIIVTLVAAGLGAAVAWRYWWTPRQKEKSEGHARRPEAYQQQQKNSSDFAFDNPYFRNSQEADEQDGSTTGRSKPFLNNKNSLRSSKLSETSAKAKKARGGKNRFGGGKKKAQDDSCIASVEPERAFVSLRGHDFTGLGFNICGNMRDGILVKDVLHRGPASESGLIKAGDKIVNVTVSFTNIVYEDALTILSYASPYDVQLEIERIPVSSTSSSATPPKRLGSCSFNNNGQKLFHPLYRSQSIDDLTQIDGGGGNGGGTFPSQGGPRRSQSVGVAAHFRRREQQQLGEGAKEDGGGHSSSIVLTGSLNEKMLANVMTDSRGMLQWEKRFEDTLDNDQESSTPRDESSSKKLSAKAHLDYPPNNLKLETRSESPRNNIEGVRSAGKTVVEVSGHQTRPKTSEVPLRRGRDEENDSDVSRDSLEVSHRGFAKRNAKSSNKGSVLKADQQPGRSTDHPPTKVGTERMYLKDKLSARSHSNSLSSNEEITVVQDSYSRFDSVDQNCAQQPPSKPLNLFTGPYGERQRQPDSAQDGYSGNKITVNGGPAEDHSGKGSRSQKEPAEEDRPQSKFAKKAAPAGGMFTQINPFQVTSSSKLQQRGTRGPWASAGAKEQSEFQGRRENIGYSGPKLSLKESSIKHRQF